MKKLQFQSRAVTDPIKHALVGWWKEYYFFYVKHRDIEYHNNLAESGTVQGPFQTMMLDPDWSATGASVTENAYDAETFFAGNATLPGINWTKYCLTAVVNTYFRDHNEAAADATLGDYPLAQAIPRKAHFMDSLTLDSAMPDIDPNDTSAQALEPQYRMWEYLRQMQMTNMSYDEWLRQWGVRTPKQELNEPELIRYVRQWQYPSNTVNSSTGAVVSAVSWSIAERADKDRFCKEPGFLFGVTCTRPKVYPKNVKGTLTSFMSQALDWMPPAYAHDPSASLKVFAEGTGPLQAMVTGTADYWLDLRDLLLYGEHYTNIDISASTTHSVVTIPDVDGPEKYPTSTDCDNLFAAASPANTIREDGIVSLAILGAQVDQT